MKVACALAEDFTLQRPFPKRSPPLTAHNTSAVCVLTPFSCGLMCVIFAQLSISYHALSPTEDFEKRRGIVPIPISSD